MNTSFWYPKGETIPVPYPIYWNIPYTEGLIMLGRKALATWSKAQPWSIPVFWQYSRHNPPFLWWLRSLGYCCSPVCSSSTGKVRGTPVAIICPGNFRKWARQRINASYVQVLQYLGTGQGNYPHARIMPLPPLTLHSRTSCAKATSCPERLCHTFQPSSYGNSNSLVSQSEGAGRTTPSLPPWTPMSPGNS